jgi:hypothetical protein
MKNLYQAALLTTLGLGSITAVRGGTTDLYIGFNDAAGPTSAQNDYVIDIGQFSSVLAAANTHGGTVDLMSANAPSQINQATFTSTFGSAFSTPDSGWANNVAVGVVGGQTTLNPKQLWQTMPTSVTTPARISGSALSTAANQPQALVAGEYASTTTDTGWTWLVAASPTAGGAEPSGSVATTTHINPMGQLSGGTLVLNLWQDTRNSATSPQDTGWVDEGFFTFNLNTDDITFTALGVAPEPATYGTVAGGLLLALALGRQLAPRFKRANS